MVLVVVSMTGVACDPDLGNEVAATYITAGDRADRQQRSGTSQKIVMPEHLAAIDVEGVDLIVLGGHEQHIMRGTPDGQIRDVQGLGVHVALYREDTLHGQTARR